MDRKVPLAGTGEDMNLVNPFLSRDKNLQKNFPIRRLLFGVTELLPGEIPVGVKPSGVPGGQEEATGAVTFGEIPEKFEGRGVVVPGCRVIGL
jgi:hypothetical protein